MERVRKLVGALLTFIGIVSLIGGAALVPRGVPILLALCLVYGWMLFTFLQYRWARQEELLQLLVTAVEAQVPLAPALRSYLRDRPRSLLREILVALPLLIVLPGYYWLWHRQHQFDHKIFRVVRMLEVGTPLYRALRAVPGTVSPSTIQAAAVGEATGRLALCLRGCPRGRLPAAVLEALPRLFYPLLVFTFMCGLVAFMSLFILPRIEKVATDFHTKLPVQTEVIAVMARRGHAAFVTPFVVLFAIAAGTALLTRSSTACWYCPGFGRVYRMDVRGGLLKMLSVFLEAGKPLPEALALLGEEGFFPSVTARRVRRALSAVKQGQPMADALRRAGLLPRAMVPLLQAAERSGRLPWALAELGDELIGRSVRLLRRATMLVFPVSLTAVGALGLYLALGLFLPLVNFMWRMIP